MTRNSAPLRRPANSAVQVVLDDLAAAGIDATFECGGGDNHHISIPFTNTEILITEATGPFSAGDRHSDRYLSGFMAYVCLGTRISTVIYTSPRSRLGRPCNPRTEAGKVAAAVVAYIRDHLGPSTSITTGAEIQLIADHMADVARRLNRGERVPADSYRRARRAVASWQDPATERSASSAPPARVAAIAPAAPVVPDEMAAQEPEISTDADRADLDWDDDTVPAWGPLINALGAEPVDWMWMGRIRCEDKVIEQYKHRDTRRYVNIDHDGRAWVLEIEGASGPPTMSQRHVGRAIAAATTGSGQV